MTPPPPRTTLFPYTTLFRSSYSGDTNNAAIATACNDPGETSVITQATPVLTTVATPTALVGGSISDTANLAGGFGTLGRSEKRRVGEEDRATCGREATIKKTKAVV